MKLHRYITCVVLLLAVCVSAQAVTRKQWKLNLREENEELREQLAELEADTRMIKELGSDPGKESIQRAEQMLKHVDKGQIPRLTTALKQAKQRLRAGQAKARTTNRGSGNARPE